jgi:hypothetical protein
MWRPKIADVTWPPMDHSNYPSPQNSPPHSFHRKHGNPSNISVVDLLGHEGDDSHVRVEGDYVREDQ